MVVLVKGELSIVFNPTAPRTGVKSPLGKNLRHRARSGGPVFAFSEEVAASPKVA